MIPAKIPNRKPGRPGQLQGKRGEGEESKKTQAKCQKQANQNNFWGKRKPDQDKRKGFGWWVKEGGVQKGTTARK